MATIAQRAANSEKAVKFLERKLGKFGSALAPKSIKHASYNEASRTHYLQVTYTNGTTDLYKVAYVGGKFVIGSR